MAKIFVSYSSYEKLIAERVHNALESLGHEAWMDQADLRGGDPWIDVIQDHIRWCEVMVVLWSESAAASPWVKDELTFARSHRKQIIPVRLDNVDATRNMIINALQIIDGRGERLEVAMHQVDEVIRRGPQAWLPQDATHTGRLTWMVVAVLVAALLLVIALLLPQEPATDPDTQTTPLAAVSITPAQMAPRASPTAAATFNAQPELASVATLNNWRTQRGLETLTGNPLLDQVADAHVRYVRSLPLAELDRTNIYRDRDGNDAQWMVNEAGYSGQVQMFVEVVENAEWTLDSLLNKLNIEGGGDIHDLYGEVGFAVVESRATQNRYYVLILGREGE